MWPKAAQIAARSCRLLAVAQHHGGGSNRWTSSSSSSSCGYQSIGSFHSDNPEELLRIPHDSYQSPPLPFEDDTPSSSFTQTDDFMLDRSRWTFLNHGAFGASLACGYNRAEKWRYHLEQQPLRYFDRDLLPHLVYSARRLAHFMNIPTPTSVALLPNVTSGLNAAIGGYTRHYSPSQSRIVLWETSYGSVKKMARAYCDNVHEISFLKDLLSHPEDPETVMIHSLEKLLETRKDWTNSLLILDETASNTAINFPIPKLAAAAKERGMLVLVDGAHGLLAQAPFDSQDVDIYLSNGHKWLSCPRGVAVMHCPCEEIQETVLRRPAIVSHGLDDGFFSRFVWDGCRDYAAALALPAVLDYWNLQNPETVRAQMRDLLTQAVSLLVHEWHGSEIPEKDWPGRATLLPMEWHSPMALVRLPPRINNAQATSADAKQIQDFLFDHYIEVPIKCIQGVLYVRLSCHVYNELHEFQRLANVVMQYPSS